MTLINNLGIVYHQYCSSAEGDLGKNGGGNVVAWSVDGRLLGFITD
jgi:hypothetical protein